MDRISDRVQDGRHLMDRAPRLYFNPRALEGVKPLTPCEHVAAWREVLAQWEIDKQLALEHPNYRYQRTGEDTV